MHNINAFFKLRAKELNYSNKDIAEQLSLSTSYVSQIFNGKKTIQKERTLKKFIHFFKCNFNINASFEKHLGEYMHAVFYMDPDRLDKYDLILSYTSSLHNTHYYIDILLVQFIQSVLSRNYDENHKIILSKLLFIIGFLDGNTQKLFYTFYFRSLDDQKSHAKAEEIFLKANSIECNNPDTNMMLNYFGFAFPWSNNRLSKDLDCYQKCKQYCEKTNNTLKLFNIEIKYAMFLGNNGDIQGEINQELKLLRWLEDQQSINNKEILLNNIAYAYSLLHHYEEALKYYIPLLEYLKDNDIYFNIAWCYYQLGLPKLALDYIKIGSNAPSRISFYYLLLEWLKAMIQKKYSQKSFDILSTILEQYKDDMSLDSYQFILIELYNYYHYHQKTKEMSAINKELSKKPVLTNTFII